MEFIIERISVQGGGLLMPMPMGKFAPEPQHLSFQWMQRVSEEKPWFYVSNPNTSWRDVPNAPDEVLITMYQSKMEECLQHDDEASKVEALKEVATDLKDCLHQLTRNGGSTGMREARELLRIQPLPIALSAVKESVPYSRNFHLLEIALHYLCEIADQPAPTIPTAVEASERLGLNLAAEFHGQLGSLLVGILRAFHDAKEYRQIEKIIAGMRGNPIISQMHTQAENEMNDILLSSYSALCDFESLFAAMDGRDRYGQISKESLTGTSGLLPPFKCEYDEQYDPRKIVAAGGSQDCAKCGRTCMVIYWCKICEDVPYCSTACADRYWEDGHKLVCCRRDGKHVGNCAKCNKRSILGCPYCKFTYYCSANCQKQHWDGGHKNTCPKKPMASPPDTT